MLVKDLPRRLSVHRGAVMRSDITKRTASRVLSIQFIASIPICMASAWMPSDVAPAAVAVLILTVGFAALAFMD